MKVHGLFDVAVIQVKVSEMSRVARHLYLKEHSVPDTHPCKPSGRTLLVLNVPPYVTEVHCRLVVSYGSLGSFHNILVIAYSVCFLFALFL